MTYHLDTNAAIALLESRPPSARAALGRALAAGADVHISAVVVFELWYGVYRSARRTQNAEALRRFLAGPIQVLPLEDEDGVTAAEIRELLRAAGTPIGPYDLLIAGQALRHDATLITANRDEFARVPGLKLRIW